MLINTSYNVGMTFYYDGSLEDFNHNIPCVYTITGINIRVEKGVKEIYYDIDPVIWGYKICPALCVDEKVLLKSKSKLYLSGYAVDTYRITLWYDNKFYLEEVKIPKDLKIIGEVKEFFQIYLKSLYDEVKILLIEKGNEILWGDLQNK